MIDLALQRLGKIRCEKCNRTQDRDNNVCKKCGKSFVKTSSPEDGLTE